jgi:hypothetical protein
MAPVRGPMSDFHFKPMVVLTFGPDATGVTPARNDGLGSV